MVYSPAYGNNGNLPTMMHLLGILNLMGEKVQILITEVQGNTQIQSFLPSYSDTLPELFFRSQEKEVIKSSLA